MFLFTHIEKCGGTSFHDILSLTYPRYFHITKNRYGGNELRNDLTKEQYHKIMRYRPSGIGGHSVRPYQEFYKKSHTKITFLRDPISRYLSHYNHQKERGWTHSIEHFLEKDFFCDFITYKIAGTRDVEMAKKLLANFQFIGATEAYNKSLNCLMDIMNKKFVGAVEVKNQRNYDAGYVRFSDLSPAQKLKVEENNRFDIQLYEMFISNNNQLNGYSDELQLKSPSKLRKKLLHKINKYKKEEIINQIR